MPEHITQVKIIFLFDPNKVTVAKIKNVWTFGLLRNKIRQDSNKKETCLQKNERIQKHLRVTIRDEANQQQRLLIQLYRFLRQRANQLLSRVLKLLTQWERLQKTAIFKPVLNRVASTSKKLLWRITNFHAKVWENSYFILIGTILFIVSSLRRTGTLPAIKPPSL